jgi:hypothetical protein
MMLDITSAPMTSACRLRAGAHHLRGRRQPVGEPGAGGEQVVAPRVGGADLVLHQTRGAREQHVGRRRADDDEVDVARRESRAGDRLARRLDREIGRRHARVDDVALADAGPLQDPLVARVDHALEIRVGEHAGRHVGGEAGDARTLHRARRRDYHRRESLPGA